MIRIEIEAKDACAPLAPLAFSIRFTIWRALHAVLRYDLDIVHTGGGDEGIAGITGFLGHLSDADDVPEATVHSGAIAVSATAGAGAPQSTACSGTCDEL